jgi:hypothetical protein
LLIESRSKLLYIFAAGIIIFLSIAPASCRREIVQQVPAVDAVIVSFEPATGTYYPGDSVASALQIKNTGKDSWPFWIGYSVLSQNGERYDVDAHPVMLEPGEISPLQEKTWIVPETAFITGYYTVAMAIWDAEPDTIDAIRIQYREAEASFQVLRYTGEFDKFNGKIWKKSDHSLGKTVFEPDNVDVENGIARIKIPAHTMNGGEFGTAGSFLYGTYRARMQVPSLAGLVTGFFLYYGTDGSGDEIDIELYYEDNWYIACTVWSGGVMTGTDRKKLKTDPSREYHEYRIDYYPGKLGFYFDDQRIQTFTEGLPEEPMRLLVNSWFPDWLPNQPPEKDVYTLIDRIQF